MALNDDEQSETPTNPPVNLTERTRGFREAGIPLSVPERDELPGRLDSVLAAIYAAFAEGWTDPGGTDNAHRDLTEEAMFLARLVTELLPEEPEALGLLALMLHAEARRRARRNAAGEYVPLAEQDAASWDSQMIAEAEALLGRAIFYRFFALGSALPKFCFTLNFTILLIKSKGIGLSNGNRAVLFSPS